MNASLKDVKVTFNDGKEIEFVLTDADANGLRMVIGTGNEVEYHFRKNVRDTLIRMGYDINNVKNIKWKDKC
jgi:hypothetical protein